MKIIFHEDQKLFRKGLVPENSVKEGPGVNSNPYLWNPKGVRSYTEKRCASFKFAFPKWVNFVTFVTVYYKVQVVYLGQRFSKTEMGSASFSFCLRPLCRTY